ncbi:MAG: AAA family ATPase [Fibromonadales bacterium]|nr:AAA family ATPase [Fibromonadales bacterium]
MKINRVELKNYRIHKSCNWNFGDGITLLLGDNGSGKSSVLEAIGFALFDSSVRSKDGEIVSKGEKSGSVKVSFLGNDGKEYEVERKFGSGASVKLASLDSLQKFEGKKEDVYRQIGKILGIDNVAGVFFESVICAKQNQFIDIFTKSPRDRSEHFNELFEVAIYNDLWEKLGEQNEKKYKETGRDKEIERNTWAAKQKNITELEHDAKKQNAELLAETEKMGISKKNWENKRVEFDKYKKMNDLINSKEKELKNSKEKIKQLADTKKYFERSLEDSQIAREFLEKNKSEFEKYEIARNQSGVLDKNLQPLRNAARYYEDLQKRAQASGFCTILNISCPKLAEKNSVKLSELEVEIAKAKLNKEQAENLQNEINKIRTEILIPMQDVYQKCLEYKKDNAKYEERKKQLALSEKNILLETESRDKFNNELNELKSNFSEDKLKLLGEEEKKLSDEHIAGVKKVEGLEQGIKQKYKEIKECKEIESIIAGLDLEIAVIRRKEFLTKIFRENIKDLGRKVAEEMVRQIAIVASDYFRDITQGSQSIVWSCLESDKYSLYLDNGKDMCSFINLSGGEQISVAISIRLALSQVFGNTGLIILDEPTNNLDRSRRQLLADNLPKMVENLTQLFVVTHDNTFENSATNVIEFKKENENGEP